MLKTILVAGVTTLTLSASAGDTPFYDLFEVKTVQDNSTVEFKLCASYDIDKPKSTTNWQKVDCNNPSSKNANPTLDVTVTSSGKKVKFTFSNYSLSNSLADSFESEDYSLTLEAKNQKNILLLVVFFKYNEETGEIRYTYRRLKLEDKNGDTLVADPEIKITSFSKEAL